LIEQCIPDHQLVEPRRRNFRPAVDLAVLLDHNQHRLKLQVPGYQRVLQINQSHLLIQRNCRHLTSLRLQLLLIRPTIRTQVDWLR